MKTALKTAILFPALAVAAFGLAACGPKTATDNGAAETVTLNDDGGAVLDNGTAPDVDGNAAADAATPPATGNAL